MPIPLTELTRTLIPRVLTPATSVEELLYLFNEQPQPSTFYAVVRIGLDAYDALTLDDLSEPAVQHGQALLSMPLGTVPGLLKPSAPLRQQSGLDAAQRAVGASPHRRLVVLDANDMVVGILGSILLAKSLPSALALINPDTGVLSIDDDAVVTTRPYLNTRFEGLAANQPLVVNETVLLVISVGAPTATNTRQTSRPFTFTFPDTATPVSFTVRVDVDPDSWEVQPLKPTMIVVPPGKTTQEARFSVTALKPGNDKFHICVEQADSGATVQHVWLQVVAAEEGVTAEAASPLALPTSERHEASLPLDTTSISRRQVEITIQPGTESFLAVVRADLSGTTIRETYRVPVSTFEIENAALRLRNELSKIVFYQLPTGSRPFQSLSTLMVDEAISRQATVPLADAGNQVWNLLFNAARAPEGLKQFAGNLRSLPEGSTIQIVLESQQFIIPWTLLYDKPGPINIETLDWHGFWGYRYIIDALSPGRYPEPIITDTPLSIQMLFNDEDNLRAFTEPQEQFINTALRGVQTSVARGDAAVQAALVEPSNGALLYFYCHGNHQSGEELAGKLGTSRAGQLASESALTFSKQTAVRLVDLRRLPAAPLASRPLVFLNACEGATQDAFYYDGFMPYFIEEQGARGFIGTEVKAPQLLAHDVALRFFRAFAEGQPVGKILWDLRRFYLDEYHTILAFNYSLYCLSEVRLAKALELNEVAQTALTTTLPTQDDGSLSVKAPSEISTVEQRLEPILAPAVNVTSSARRGVVRLAVIGAGRIGSMHAQNLAQRIPGAQLVAVSDLDLQAAQRCAAASGASHAYTDPQPILDDKSIEAVLICSSTDTHATLIEQAAAAGKHIFCEKPIAFDLATIDRALQAVEKAGVKLQIGFNRRFDPGFAAARQAVLDKQIGTPHLVRITSRDPQPPSLDYIRVSGGLFLDMSIHDFDMARFLLGEEVVGVFATGAVLVDPAIGAAKDIDTAVITLRFASGAIAAIDNSRRAVYGYDQRLEVFGSNGAITVGNLTPHNAALLNESGVHAAKPLFFFVERYTEAYIAELRAFIDCIRQDQAPRVTGHDGRAPVVIALAAARSHDLGRMVSVQEIDQR